jgi:hypothetical protein
MKDVWNIEAAFGAQHSALGTSSILPQRLSKTCAVHNSTCLPIPVPIGGTAPPSNSPSHLFLHEHGSMRDLQLPWAQVLIGGGSALSRGHVLC